MLHALALAAALSSPTNDSPAQPTSAVHACLESMDGAIYHGDPTDKTQVKSTVEACEGGAASILTSERADAAHGPEKLFLLARVLDRSATLSYMGLHDVEAALRNVQRANLYFRVATGLAGQNAEYHAAAVANVQLTTLQLQTLHTDISIAAANGKTVARAAH